MNEFFGKQHDNWLLSADMRRELQSATQLRVEECSIKGQRTLRGTDRKETKRK